MTEEMPPDLDEPPVLDDPPGDEWGDEAVHFEDEAERAVYRPSNADYESGSGTSYSGLNDDYQDPYLDLGGLTRPDAYFGAIEFDCPTCEAKGRSGDFGGEKCKVWVERLGRMIPRKMPCLTRLKLARERGII
jgi:hypothetical protein